MDAIVTAVSGDPAPTSLDVQKGRVKPKVKLCPDISPESPVVIVGAGLTGLACALALSDLSIDSVVIEERSNENLISGGAGINLQAKAIECLNALGITTASLIDNGNIILKQSYYCPDGRHICTIDKSTKGSNASDRPGQIAIHRGKLMKLLLEKTSQKKIIRLMDKRRVIDVKNLDEGVSIETKIVDQKENQVIYGSLALGADGIYSRVRDVIFAAATAGNDPYKYHGVTHYRGVVQEFPTFLDGKTMLVVGGTETKFVVYPITFAEEGRQTINWIACVKEEKATNYVQEHLQKHILDIIRSSGFKLDFLDLGSLVKKTEAIKAWPMVDLEPLDSWTCGRVTLVGDSAHAMLPVGSGGAMAGFLDALAIKQAFETSGPVPGPNIIKLFQVMRYDAALNHQEGCRVQPAEKIVQEILDQGQRLCKIPDTYTNRIRSAMKKLHTPTSGGIGDTRESIEKQVLIVGAGASGIATCKEFLENGFNPIVFESGATFGGVFRDAYENLELTSSSAFTAFSDYPPKEEVPTMWTSREYLTYLHSYAADNDVFQHIRYNSTVVGVKRIKSKIFDRKSKDGEVVSEQSELIGENTNREGCIWEVAVLNSVSNRITRIRSRILVLCVGSNVKPNIPSFSKQDMYKGQIVHTSDIDSFEIFRGKRVLCLGIGESGSDVPYWVAKEPGTKVTIAVRGMGWCVPRRRPLRTGLPADLNTNRLLWGLPRYLNHVISFLMAYFDSRLDSDPVIRNMGLLNLKHSAGFYKTYGTKSIKFLVAIEHLGVQFIPSTISEMSGYNVEFEDGSSGEFDMILLNTGYQKSNLEGFCFDRTSMEVDHDATLFQVLKEASYGRNLYKRVVHPAIDNLFFIGLVRPAFGSIPVIAEIQARWLAALASGKCPSLPTEDDMTAIIADDKAQEEAQFNGSSKRVGTLVDYLPYVSDIASLLKATPPYLKYLLTDPLFLLRLFVCPATVAQFRLRGPNAKPKVARNTIESYPMPSMKRRLYIMSFGLYVSSLLILIASVAVPMTSKARKALFPVGFPPLQRGGISHTRYFMGCFHILALALFYATVFDSPFIGYTIIIVTSVLEILVIANQKRNKSDIRNTLTARKYAVIPKHM